MGSALKNLLDRSLWIFVFLLASMQAQANLVLWPIEARTGLAEGAERANWTQFIRTEADNQGLLLKLPSEEGLSDYLAAVAGDSPDLGVLSEGAALALAEGSVWVKLDPVGALWVLVRGESSSSINTSATAEGFQQGLAWVNQQLSLPPAMMADLDQPGRPQPTPGFVYRAPGQEIRVLGVRDDSDFLRLTQSIQNLPEVQFSYVSALRGSEVSLVIGSSLGGALDSLLVRQPWLEPAQPGTYRWNAGGAILTTPANAEAQPGARL